METFFYSVFFPASIPEYPLLHPFKYCVLHFLIPFPFSLSLFFFFFFLGPHPQHVEVLRLGVKSELQLLAHTPAQQLQIRAASATYTTAHGNAGPLTHRARPGIKPASSWILVGPVTTEPRWERLLLPS